MEISLIRHGKSLLTDNDKITCMRFREWVEKYDFNGVFEESTYPSQTLDKITTAKIVITSDLKRSVESAKILNAKLKTISNPLFRETELPTPSLKLLSLKLRPSIWGVLLRLIWFSGYSNECESLIDAKLRAKIASQQLIDYADEYKSVIMHLENLFSGTI
ncbi:broad specificity phosphatase PhoE [Bacillus mesophilus]|uniref:Histidine phosphatase family protein n=1 Tax=Bacillus mesophilus TaxID=1808955 RepID=A0A6M0Q9A8_9BACI|nr:histidine phosphatase family protein [Bacillus mesophilus]MBM7661808.1 broad specificity phosphatase PhoE [Bacillus mesophilus]NEY72827.1 histidine phosphatase family protein [Bacillus mesophilus]